MKKKYTYLIIIFLIVASLAAFGRILGNDFINFDDAVYITENNHIQSGINPGNIKWAFTAIVCSNWHPLTLLSHTLDWSLFGADASGHHLINLLLHIGSVIFLFLFLNRTTKNLWSSAFAAALFALHPLRVESVAWAAERKDVLSMFFGLASIYAYACYVESFKLSKYFLCLILFALALMSKPMLVTLPFVLLLLDYWPLGRWQKEVSAPVKTSSNLIGRLLWEKAPFILLAIVSSVVTIWAQNKGGSVASMKYLSFSMRAANAIISYVSYLEKTFRPVDLAVFYPYEYSFTLWQVLACFFILIGITTVVIYTIKKLPFLFVGWSWYLGTLIPVIGLVQVGRQSMADRYTYLPSIGIVIMLAWGIPSLIKSEEIRKKILFPAEIAVLAILAVLTWQQCGYWKNSATLFNYALQVTKDNYLAHNGLGIALFKEGKIEEAIDHYNEANRIAPYYEYVYNNRGNAYDKMGQHKRAIEDYNEAIRLKPDYANAYVNRGNIYNNLGQHKQAIEDYNKAIRLKSDYADAYYNRGVAYAKLDQRQRAIEDYNQAIRLKPDYADAIYNRGVVYGELGQYQQAIKDYNEAIRLKPDYVRAYNNRGYAYSNLGQHQRAIEDFNKALRLKSDYVDAYYNRGFAYANLGHYQRAIDDFNETIRLNPGDADAYSNRGTVYLNQGNKKLGCFDAQKACKLGNCRALEWAQGKRLCH